MTAEILVGDALGRLAEQPSGSARTIITSPPYWGLRDYGVEGQLGLEATPEEYVEKLVIIFREARRVLADDGTLWLNLGDSYAGSWGAQSRGSFTEGTLDGAMNKEKSLSGRQILAHPHSSRTGSLKNTPGIKAKDLVGIPWLVAFALRSDGWWLRSDIIWSKPNPMPESVSDRPTKAHEYLFLLSKSERYFYNAEAIAEPSTTNDLRRPYAPGAVDLRGNGHDRGGGTLRRQMVPRGWATQSADHSSVAHMTGERPPVEYGDEPVAATRNKRSVWTVPTFGFPEAHFATFPPDLIRPCILAGSEPGDLVLDPFSGAGTTGLVALQHGRRYLGIELNPGYAVMSEARLAPLLAQPRMLEPV